MKRGDPPALILLLLVACGGGGSSPTSSGSSSTSSTGGDAAGVDAFVTEYCELTDGTCCVQSGRSFNADSCARLVRLSSLESGVTYDAAAAEACLAGLRIAKSTPRFCISRGDAALRATCGAVWRTSTTGTKPVGEECTGDAECIGEGDAEVSCEVGPPTPAFRRRCQIRTHAKEGEACAGDRRATPAGDLTYLANGANPDRASVCWVSDGVYCKSAASNGICTKQSVAGGPCTHEELDACAPGFRCDETKNTCVARNAVGEKCPLSDGCVENAYCDDRGTCAALIAIGQPCTSDRSCGPTGIGDCTTKVCRRGGLSLSCGN